jgi:UDP-N-acetyl-D-glucosamine dehydrogenase
VTAPERLVVVGQGHVGLPIAMSAVDAGFSVVGLDTDAARIWALQDGQSHVEEVCADRLRRALSSGRYLPTGHYVDADRFDHAIITVPTPFTGGLTDLSHVTEAVCGLALHLRPGATVVLESTTYPGTTEELVAPLLEVGSGLVAGRDFAVGYSPARAEPGNRHWRFENTPKVVSGTDESSLSAVRALYDRLVETTVPVAGTREAELAKLIEDAFRHVNIALINEMAVFARELGVDVWQAVEAAATKPFSFCRFTPGPGPGGECLPVGARYLSARLGRDPNRDSRLVTLANDINDHMPDYVVHRLATTLNRNRKSLGDSVVLLLGLSCAADTGDVRESAAMRVVELLNGHGAVTWAVDAHVEPHRCPPSVKLVELAESVLREADAVVLLTDHDDLDYDLVERHARLLLDTRHRVSGPRVEYL